MPQFIDAFEEREGVLTLEVASPFSHLINYPGLVRRWWSRRWRDRVQGHRGVACIRGRRPDGVTIHVVFYSFTKLVKRARCVDVELCCEVYELLFA